MGERGHRNAALFCRLPGNGRGSGMVFWSERIREGMRKVQQDCNPAGLETSIDYSTVTDFARFLGLSTSSPL